MTLNAKPRMDVVKREDKETKLRAFIANHLKSGDAAATSSSWSVIARSMESPVILALAALAPDILAAGVSTRMLFTQTPPSIADSSVHPVMSAGCEVRYASDARLLDAHEQLVLNGNTSWVGDCMRREPSKRDAYECYAAGCADTAAWNNKAFDRLWAFGEPVVMTGAATVSEETATPAINEFPLPAGEIPSTVVALTRH